MSESLHLGILGGTELPGNVNTLLSNVRRLLDSCDQHFDCDLLTSADLDPPNGYRLITITHGDVATARARMKVLFRALTTYVNQEQPDVLLQITRFPTHGPAVALAGQQTRTPTITRLAGDNFREYRFTTGVGNTLQTFVLKNLISLTAVHLSTAVVVLGPTGRRDIRMHGRRSGVWEIPQPVDTTQFTPGDADQLRESLGIGLDERLLLTVGRVSRRKGAECIRRVAATRDEPWVVVGDGPMREMVAEVSTVHTVGRVPHDKIADYYRAADVYVHPSLHEGLPNALLEATACGTSCIARDVGECEMIAESTFETDAELQKALDRTYNQVELDPRFKDEHLAEQYCRLLTGVVDT
jgi:glycosyltransferase involved in cell wall biosynthesis